MSSQRVHSVRFYNVEPTAINCMSYNKDTKKLALSRSDNSIEIWDLSHTPHIDRVIQGSSSGSVESLVWCGEGKRLFSSGLNGMVVEYDMLKLLPKYSAQVISGACWCMEINHENSMIAAGTEDGYINLLHIDQDSLMFNKILDKQEGRIMCLAWDVSGERLATGSEDSVRIWSIKSGHAIHRMTTGRTVTNRPTIVWAIAATNDFTVITGDSRGKLCFWDGNTGNSIASHQSHKADVLCLCLDDLQTTVYAAGVDPLVATFEQVKLRAEPDSTKWVRSIQRRIHENDVRALAFAHGKLFSGGVDGYLSLSSYPPKVLLRYPPLLQPPCVYLAPEARCLLLRYPLHLELWQLATSHPLPSSRPPRPVKLVTVVARDRQRVRCAAVSPDARWIAYSTDALFRLYAVELPPPSEKSEPRMTRVRGLSAECSAVHCATFSPDSSLLVCATSCSTLLTFQLSADAGPSLLHTINPHDDKLMTDVIHLLSISADNRFIVAADRASNIVVWSNGQYYCSLPKYRRAPTAMAIQATSNNLVVVYCDHKIMEYSLEGRKYTKFSRKLNDNHPKQWLARSFPVNNVVFDPANDDIIMMHDDSTICVIDKTKSLPSTEAKIPRLETSHSPSMQDLAGESSNQHHPPSQSSQFAFHVVKKYKHLVYLGCVGVGEMVAVEVNPLTLVEKLPPSLKQKQFGAM